MKSILKTIGTFVLLLCMLKGIAAGMMIPVTDSPDREVTISQHGEEHWFLGLLSAAFECKNETEKEKEGKETKNQHEKLRLGKLVLISPTLLYHNASALMQISHQNWVLDHYLDYFSLINHYRWLRFHFLKIPVNS